MSLFRTAARLRRQRIDPVPIGHKKESSAQETNRNEIEDYQQERSTGEQIDRS